MSKPLDIADLDYAIEGPDRRYQTHGPGCRCGDLACPWFQGEQAAHVYREVWTRDQRLMSWAEACVALTGPSPTVF